MRKAVRRSRSFRFGGRSVLRTGARGGGALLAAAILSVGVPDVYGVVATYRSANNTYTGVNESVEDPTHTIPGHNRNHPGFGFAQTDGEWDDGVTNEFEFSGSDGGYFMNARAAMDLGFTSRAGDHAGYLEMDYSPTAPGHSFGGFWFGGIGADSGPTPGTNTASILFFVDVLAPLGQPYTVRAESNFTAPAGNGFRFLRTGTGTWETVGGTYASAEAFGAYDFTDPVIGVFAAFGPSEITTVDDGTVDGHKGTLQVDNVTLTVAAAAWNNGAGGNWSENGNWQPNFAPDGANTVATFGSVITAPTTVTVDGERFAGTVVFDNANSYTLDGAATSTLIIRAVGAGTNGAINAVSGSHTISAPLELWSDTTVTVAQASATLTASNMMPSPFPITLTKAGPGTLAVNRVHTGALAVNGGSVKVLAGGTANSPAGASRVNNLSIAAGASLDLTNNSMVIDYTGPVGTLVGDTRQNLAAGRLKSTSATLITGLGYADNAALDSVKTTFAGQTVDPSSLLIKFTYFGDADLDGDVDVADLGKLATSWQTAGVWSGGDFDYNGSVDVNDLGLLASNWQAGVGSPLGPDLASALASLGLPTSAVPEPASVVGVGVLALACGSRRPRRRNARS